MGVRISAVTPGPSNDLITAVWLDYPRTGPVDGYSFEVFGWVVSKAPVVQVEFVHGGIVVASCELTISRPDVAGVYGSSSPVGFQKAIGTVGLAPDFTIEVRAVSAGWTPRRNCGNTRQAAANLGPHFFHAASRTGIQRIGPQRIGSTILESSRGLADRHNFRRCALRLLV